MPSWRRSPGESGGAAKTTGERATAAAAAVPAALRTRNSRRLSFLMHHPPGWRSGTSVPAWGQVAEVARRRSCRSDHFEFAHRAAGGPQVVEAHLGVLARQDHAVRAGLEGGLDGLVDVVGLRLLLARSGRDVDVDAGPDLQP